MKRFDLIKEYNKTISDSNIVKLLFKIHEYKGKQSFLIDTKKRTLDTLLNVAKIQSTSASNKIEGLGITSLYAKRDMIHRYNSLFLGKFNDIKIVGFKSSFSQSFGIEEPLFKVIKGIGLNKESNVEGFRIKNVFGTYVLGPILVFNPLFTKHILDLLGVKYKKLELEEELMDCYKDRLEEFENNFTKFD